MKNAYTFWNSTFRNELAIIPEPTLKNPLNDTIENLSNGRQPDVTHSTRLFTPLRIIVCQTMAHAPYPPKAMLMPTTAPAIRPSVFDTATIFTSIRFISRLV
jgi:hypothetical protein